MMCGAEWSFAQQANIQTCEYWFDYDFEGRTSVAMNGSTTFEHSFDISNLPRGLHSIGMRFADSDGLYSPPFIKHFVIPALPEESFPDNRIAKMEYWFDYNFEERQKLENVDGNVAISLDVSEFAPGVHSFAYRAIDSRGLYSYPLVKHFVIPSMPDEEITGIAYYEYWFNHGPRVHVDVDLQNPLTLENQIIEVKDVVPNKITEDYKFDVETGIITVDDIVFFGIQPRTSVFRSALGELPLHRGDETCVR